MTAVFITVYRQRTLPRINEERSVQGQINQIIHDVISIRYTGMHIRSIGAIVVYVQNWVIQNTHVHVGSPEENTGGKMFPTILRITYQFLFSLTNIY